MLEWRTVAGSKVSPACFMTAWCSVGVFHQVFPRCYCCRGWGRSLAVAVVPTAPIHSQAGELLLPPPLPPEKVYHRCAGKVIIVLVIVSRLQAFCKKNDDWPRLFSHHDARRMELLVKICEVKAACHVWLSVFLQFFLVNWNQWKD